TDDPLTAKRVRAHDRSRATAHGGQKRRVAASGPFAFALPRIPKGIHVRSGETGCDSAEMIGMRMRKNDQSDARAPFVTQCRCEYAAAGIEWTSDQAAAVDDKCISVGEIDECRIALTDIEKGDAKLSFRCAFESRHDFEYDHARDAAHCHEPFFRAN